jgi:hypothetical protein
MTLLLPTPRTVAYTEFHEVTIRLRNLVLFLLTRPSSGPRHRLRTARRIRWQRYKSALARRLDPGPGERPVPPPRRPVRPPVRSSRVSGWSAQHPPPRTAQSRASAALGGDRWADRQTRTTAYALPNTAPTFVPDFAPTAVPDFAPTFVPDTVPTVVAAPTPFEVKLAALRAASRAASAEPVTCPLTWPEESPEPWAESWREPWAEPPAETRFTGHVEEADHREPARPVASFHYPVEHGEYGADRRTEDEIIRDFAASVRAHTDHTPDHAVTDHTADWSTDWSAADPSPADRPTAGDQAPRHAAPSAHSAHSADDTAPAEPEDEDLWEFRVGDLARWWDEVTARLDAAARATRAATGCGDRAGTTKRTGR